jgi:hypothetical protein
MADPIRHLPISLRLNFKQIVCHAGGNFLKVSHALKKLKCTVLCQQKIQCLIKTAAQQQNAFSE